MHAGQLPSNAHRHGAALRRVLTAASIAGVLSLTGCTFKAGGFENENDELRARVQTLEDELTAMTRDRNEWRAKARAAAVASSDGVSGVVLEALPRITGIDIDRLTGLVDRDGEPGYEGVDVYVLPKDARNRFVQAVGTLRVSLIELTPSESDQSEGGGGGPRLVAERVLSPGDVRDAYRNTLLSVHYSIPLALDPVLIRPETDRTVGTNPDTGPMMQVVVVFEDALSGQTFTATRLVGGDRRGN